MKSSDIAGYEQRRQRLIHELAAARASGVSVGLAKATSNLFRHRVQQGTKRIDVRPFHHVLNVDIGNRVADVEGNAVADIHVEHVVERPHIDPLRALLHSMAEEVRGRLRETDAGAVCPGGSKLMNQSLAPRLVLNL